MVYTVTFNPSIDYIVGVEKFVMGRTNRSSFSDIQFGGKGINVSTVLSRLGVQSVALGFIAGFTGEALKKQLQKESFVTDFITLDGGNTRINIKLKTDVETEINDMGPSISEEKMVELLNKLDALKTDDILVLSGSVPKNVEHNIYERIITRVKGKGVRVVVDAAGKLLVNTLKHKPFLIKPNLQELEEIVGNTLETDEDIISSANNLRKMGALNVLVSLGKRGAILVTENDEVHIKKAVGKRSVNTVGAGDSMVAGFIAGLPNGYDYALKLSLASAGATACSKALAEKKDILGLLGEF